MKEIKAFPLIIFTGCYGVFSLIVFLYMTWSGLSIWMGINVGFAMIPWIIIVYLYERFMNQNMKVDWLIILGLIVFIFFYPNAFYILTDFMHLDSVDFYTTELYQGNTYLLEIRPYFMMFHIILSAIIGSFAGIQSLLYLEHMVTIKFKNNLITSTVTIIILILSSLGIYIGRFLRFFSWDVLRPFILLKEVYQSITPFTFQFILLFTLVEAMIYFSYKLIIVKTPNV